MLLCSFAKLRRATVRFVLSAFNNSAPSGRIFMKFDARVFFFFFFKSVEKVKISLKSDKNNGTLHEDVCSFVTVSRRILFTVRSVSDSGCRENQNTHFAFNNFLPKTCCF